VDALIHTASPFPAAQPRDRGDLIRPAVEGTLRALGSAYRASVRRAVITSSIAAVVNTDLPAGRTVYDERDWSDPEGPKCTAYSASKTRAERAAWDFVDSEAPDLRLTAINPGFVLGPGLDDRLGTSLGVVARLLTGKDPLVPRVGFPVVDVRDVARLHVAALETPASEGQRVLAADRSMSFPEMARTLKQAFPDRRVVTREAPDWLIRMLARFDRSIATIAPDLGRRIDVSAERARAMFGISFIAAPDALLASARMLIDRRLV
jgi:dihydroflavonol-4-reductase